MNSLRRALPLWSQFAVIMAIAIAIPVLVMGLVLVDSSNRLSQHNLEAYVQRTGEYQLHLIETDLNQVIATVNLMLDNPQVYNLLTGAARSLSLAATSQVTRDRLTQRTVQDLREHLLAHEDRLVESVWLLNTEGTVLLSTVNHNRQLPFTLETPREHTSDSFRRGQELASIGQRQTLVLADRGGSPNFEIVTVLYDAVEQVTGYLVVDLDLNKVVLRHLETIGTIPSYTYLVLPDGVTTLQRPEVRRENLVNPHNPAVRRALDSQTRGVLSYEVETHTVRDIVGYYAPLLVLGQRVGLVVEVDLNIVDTQRAEYFSQAGFPLVIGFSGLLFALALLLTQLMTPPLAQLRRALQSMLRGSFNAPITFHTRADEFGAVGTDFLDMREQVERLVRDLQSRLTERERDVRLTQEISRAALAERDLTALLSKFVTLITDTFSNIYHAQVFLIDQGERYAMLRASTGRAGQMLLQRGHRLEVGSVSVIGQVTEQGQPVLVRDIDASAVHRQNEFLPETQAELAIPLRLGERVIGALDVQSRERDSFTPAQVSALQTLADQITIAVENARLYEQSQRLLRTVEQETRERSQRSWQELFTLLRTEALTSRAGNLTDYDATLLRAAVLRTGQTVVATRTSRRTIPVGVPIRLRGLIIGVVEFELREADFSHGRVMLAEELVNRLAISLDNARLFLENARIAEREHLVNDISSQLTTENTIRGIVETAIRQVEGALGSAQVGVRFNLQPHDRPAGDDTTLVTLPASEERVP